MRVNFIDGVGVLVYIGHKGVVNEIIGGRDGELLLKKLG